MTFKTDALFHSSDTKAFQSVNICGQEVEVRRVTCKGLKDAYFNAYVLLPHSSVLSDSFLGYPTYRKDDWVGVDTAHSFNDDQSEAEKFGSALGQIESVITAWKSAIKEASE
jgi:hypothetical protein